MTVIDASILLYAYNADSPDHKRAARWLNKLIESHEVIGLPWATVWAFLRISTNPRLWDKPIPARDAVEIVSDWMSLPDVVLLNPGPRHWDLVSKLITDYKANGPLVAKAAIAALALENGAAFASTDQDFARFKALRWLNPLRN